jgi:adenylate cyclase
MLDEPILLTRRLTTVLLADVVGYSRMMSRDEDGAHARIARYALDFIEPTIDQYRGRFVRTFGDSLLVEFGSAIDGVHCALDIQRGLRERQVDDPERFQLRMGINTGDVIVDKRDIYGHSVNITARLESLSEPGTIYVSQSIYDQTRSHPGLFFADKGLLKVKNIDYPVHAYQVADTPIPAPSLRSRISSHPALLSVAAITVVLAVSGIVWFPGLGPVTPVNSTNVAPANFARVVPVNSIVVLPFRNLSGKPEEEYVADAITDDVITDLSRLQRVTVIASATALTYKNKPSDVRQIGRELGTRFALEGSVKRIGPAVQVNAQLIDAQSGTHLWANRFTHEGTSLLALQEAITGRIAATLNMESAQVQRRHEVGTLAADGNPLDERLRAMSTISGPGFNEEKSLEARGHIEAALKFNPDSAELHAVLAQLLINDYLNRWNKATLADVDRAEKAISESLSLDPSQPVAQYALGAVLRVRGKQEEALAAFEAAIQRNPSFARAHAQRANQLVFLRQPKEAIQAAQRAIALSPKDTLIGTFYWILGRAYFVDNGWPDAIKWLNKSVEEHPNVWFNRAWLIAAYVKNDQKAEAQSLVLDYKNAFPSFTLVRITEMMKEGMHQSLDPTARENLINGLQVAGL